MECGTGVCGGACTSTCDATEVCVGNTCCDTTTECDGFECGTGVCGGDCPSSCDATEVCEGNTCVCDTANECNGLECGTGVCGGDCSSSCDSESEVCIVNSCEPFFTVPSSASNWSVNHTGCIKWNVDALQETQQEIFILNLEWKMYYLPK